MAAVDDVALTVARPDGAAECSIRVAYTASFERWERDAWFRDVVRVHRVGPDGRRLLVTMERPAWQAAAELGEATSLRCVTPTAVVPASALEPAEGSATVRLVTEVEVLPHLAAPARGGAEHEIALGER
jgi:hypothetical protein